MFVAKSAVTMDDVCTLCVFVCGGVIFFAGLNLCNELCFGAELSLVKAEK